MRSLLSLELSGWTCRPSSNFARSRRCQSSQEPYITGHSIEVILYSMNLSRARTSTGISFLFQSIATLISELERESFFSSLRVSPFRSNTLVLLIFPWETQNCNVGTSHRRFDVPFLSESPAASYTWEEREFLMALHISQPFRPRWSTIPWSRFTYMKPCNFVRSASSQGMSLILFLTLILAPWLEAQRNRQV